MNMYVQFLNYQLGYESDELGPFDFVQITYDYIKGVREDIEIEVGSIQEDGRWFIFPPGTIVSDRYYTDVCIYSK